MTAEHDTICPFCDKFELEAAICRLFSERLDQEAMSISNKYGQPKLIKLKPDVWKFSS